MSRSLIPALVIAYNQYTYIRQMIEQLDPYIKEIIVIDNHSTFPPLLSYYEKDFHHKLLRQSKNHGHGVYLRDDIQELVGKVYLLTDPDLEWNPNLPSTWVQDLLNISNKFQALRVGFALDISASDIRKDISVCGYSVQEWESAFWKNPIQDPRYELYAAPIDTTLSLVNKNFPNGPYIRVAGDYTCKHKPWHENFKDGFLEGEYETFVRDNNSTHWRVGGIA